ncbi:hypothetical protein MKW98_021402 [Papaver atlanticum]|uniref:Uncharacterized protein n=1 Tax=Papaver atlanticum TaxID=357466 RepID=A0AAD4SRM3_9MAGN|nr:hypothetical protein MKW98_021402 [Papaver atlanticum]
MLSETRGASAAGENLGHHMIYFGVFICNPRLHPLVAVLGTFLAGNSAEVLPGLNVFRGWREQEIGDDFDCTIINSFFSPLTTARQDLSILRYRLTGARDLQVDLGILGDLRSKLQEFFNAQMGITCADIIEIMMLGKLHSFLNKEIPDGFRKWIEQQLDGENWVDMLQFWDARIEELKGRAKAEGIPTAPSYCSS